MQGYTVFYPLFLRSVFSYRRNSSTKLSLNFDLINILFQYRSIRCNLKSWPPSICKLSYFVYGTDLRLQLWLTFSLASVKKQCSFSFLLKSYRCLCLILLKSIQHNSDLAVDDSAFIVVFFFKR